MKSIDEDILLIIEKEISGNATVEDIEVLNSWLSSDESHKKEYQVLRQLYQGHQALINNNPFDTDTAWVKVSSRMKTVENSSKKNIIYPWYYLTSAAAAIVIIFFCIWFFKYNNQTITITALDANEHSFLPDSSSVSLKKGSILTYNRSFKNLRQVTIKGIAYFDVKHSNSNSFTVIANNTIVQDIGTTFMVNSTALKDEITVFSGEIKCTNLVTKAVVNGISAGKKIINDSNGFLVSNFADTNVLSWKSGVLDFSDVSLTKALEDISLHYGIIVKCLPSNLSNNITIKLHFDNQPIQEVLDEIKLVTKLQLRKNSNEFIFYQSVKNESHQAKKQI